MKKQALLVVSILLLGASSLQASGWDRVRQVLGVTDEAPNASTTKVLLKDRIPGEMLEITGSYNVYDPALNKKIGTRFGDKRYFAQPTASGIKWGEQFPGVYQIEIVPDDAEQTTILLGGIQYKGSMLVYQIGQQLSFVNKVTVEDFIQSQVSQAIMGQEINDEALAALIIVARTNATYQTQRDSSAHWFVKAKEGSYFGQGVIDPRVERISGYTKGLVMQSNEYGNTEGVFAALWTEDSAGHTAPYKVIFRQQANGPSNIVDTPFAGQNRGKSKWSYTASKVSLASKLGTGFINNLEIYRDDASGKVYGMQVVHSDGNKNFDYEDLIEMLGSDKIQSSEFSVAEAGDSITFTGYGRGHGVGLCLYSANVMASYGKDAPEILEEFFPNSELSVSNPLSGAVR